MSVTDVAFDPATGLAPAIVQNATSKAVLMLGYVNEESLELTAQTGYVHFWSRSRNTLWRKGATSGNSFEVVDTTLDCDEDTVLFRVRPAGPACHRGTTTCFDPVGESSGDGATAPPFDRLGVLWETISARARDLPEGSYTARLLGDGVDGPGRKVVEEATEVLLAARDHRDGGSPDRVHEEVADLFYHVLVLLAERGLDPAGALAVLEERAT